MPREVIKMPFSASFTTAADLRIPLWLVNTVSPSRLRLPLFADRTPAHKTWPVRSRRPC